ncbi:MAG TPA: response regulator transcription factor [Chloroflexota bacterium]|nr:response regulator transcription factor [Chloroflexota bacterium]
MSNWDRHTVLLVEPDDEAAAQLVDELSPRYRLAVVGSAAAARAWLGAATPGAIVLELALPDADGLIFCAHMRSRTVAPILVYTVRSDTRDLLLSLRLGADDFVPKPAEPGEIDARVGALIRRANRTARPRGRTAPAAQSAAAAPTNAPSARPTVQRIGDLTIDREGLSVSVGGRPLYLTASELRILLVLARHLNEPLSRAELARLSGGPEHLAGSRSLDMHVRRLRAKLRGAHGQIPGIVPVRGFGYRMVHAAPVGGKELAPPAA